MYERMLVCLDGSAFAEQILPYVEAQAKFFNTDVTLIQVIIDKTPEIVSAGPHYFAVLENENKSAESTKQAWNYLQNLAKSFNQKGISTTAVVIKAASAGHAIVKYAENNGITLIAMTTHGRSGFFEVLFGSVAEYVYKISGLPILLVKPSKK
jgi:nucleotide-binding universal stress UspA family protein